VDISPVVVERPAQAYAYVARSVTMAELGSVLPPLISDVFAWLEAQGQQPAGPPFWKYDVIDMDSKLTVEVGVPIDGGIDGGAADGQVAVATVPAGRYVTALYVCEPAGLEDATRALLEWAHARELAFDVTTEHDGEHWVARLEEYLTDPNEEPDRNKWQTRLAFRLR
jgi:effector-binding domain-containing protein